MERNKDDDNHKFHLIFRSQCQTNLIRKSTQTTIFFEEGMRLGEILYSRPYFSLDRSTKRHFMKYTLPIYHISLLNSLERTSKTPFSSIYFSFRKFIKMGSLQLRGKSCYSVFSDTADEMVLSASVCRKVVCR